MAGSKTLWFLTGLGVGAAIGMLYAPFSGEDTRDLIGRKTEEGRNLVTRKTGELRQQVTEIADRGRQAVNRQVDQFQAAVDAGKQAYREASSSTPETGS